MEWKTIDSAPKGKIGWYWMLLAYGTEGDKTTGYGYRWGDRFFAASSFFCLGKEKKFEMREHEVFPTHWMEMPEFQEEE